MAPAQQKVASGLPPVATTRLNRIWRSNTVSFASKFKLYKSLVTPILLYVCETGTLLPNLRKVSRHSKTKCPRELVCISCLEHKTNDWVRREINIPVSPQDLRLSSVTGRKLAWFGHATRHDSLSKPSFRTPWMTGDAAVGRGNAGWTPSKSVHPCPCRNCSQRPPADDRERISPESCVMSFRRPSRPRD